jgi:XTP/dITP diphosphohydrolase
MIERLLLATRNPGKIHEFAEALSSTGVEVLGLDSLGDVEDVEETGDTFTANAKLKAEGYSRLTDVLVLADDSGLEVDALGGEPGVHSARYGGDGLDDVGRYRLVLEHMQDVSDPAQRTARFKCVLAVAQAGITLATFEGSIEGQLLMAPRGEQGFGYDPIFFHVASGCTTAEMATAQKRLISHRGEAIAAFLKALKQGDPRLAASI